MEKVEQFRQFLDERLKLSNNLPAQAAYLIVKNQFDKLFNKPVETTNEQPILTNSDIEMLKAALITHAECSIPMFEILQEKLDRLKV